MLNNMTGGPASDLGPTYCWESDESISNVFGFIQLLFFLFSYGYVLFFSSNLISDGSELLLLIPKYEGLVGSVVLPILGAVPDGAIVLFSGLGADAQNQLNVGMGGLAGSTVMLLTIPWLLAVYAGRVNIENGVANYGKKPKLFPENNQGLFTTGVTPSGAIKENGFWMVATSMVSIQHPTCSH
jgi:hypothetical protein